jgi:WW domain-containing oxidoreductase
MPNVAPWANATQPGAVVTDQQAQEVDAYDTHGKIGDSFFSKGPIDEACRAGLYATTFQDVVQDRSSGLGCKISESIKQAHDGMLRGNL